MKKNLSDYGWMALLSLLVLCVALFTGCSSGSSSSGDNFRGAPGQEEPDDDVDEGDKPPPPSD